ncbi:ankyrin repeat domain-containing protein 50-like isoform X3 [Portunus trituberculatus]|uniref:ankyrin repeat domain-containing protein 50-like isoform X3 n=1 Tax=Portunus trituberculatus TaxID=210409 RepID=UPI001E1CEABA|nr:ankyrin repeat domain-containing protein 50-like isoform X3 [Portunus trituberculatus]XP_045116689.1 ankyrin repeat domain-containing protein 50-like isoform X3 [Portunus trituberculatus]XP_045116690.1 ankyrin repeat domain-containing protein 50-like isoform X3 [Portunus trituberculatus]XP_045116691.1 ankyrin repeat domain-containing protein 50-like isoform X3 [Portunus trituberculatus]XP_045116692.1 ankyrin repeat domain-containing protein 50-like isoform X3 [Portunus trituberculatus]XP_04
MMEHHENMIPCQCPSDFGEVLPKEMYLAAKHGQLRKIKQYLEKGHDVNACDEDSCSLLASASIANRLEVVRFLHRFPQLHRNVTDWSGDTPLMHAARMGHREVVEELLTCPHPCRLNVDILNSHEDKAETIAIASSNEDIARLIQNTQLPRLQWHPDLCQALVPARMPVAEVIFECNVCYEDYDTRDRRPRVLSCGHSLCTTCISMMLGTGRLVCALCRCAHNSRINRATDLPVNYELDKVLQERQHLS